ncbi:hypothetical protein KR093_011369 [Drosophila rubida]|uniref:Uncharacterized protein n=1 Tax=Drosophila rubida TaxID=30044 RepID=A0AAD4JWH2_9MUSC|nr:hypothetical protein KR093_011369 [Drosophila rubida]
MNLHINIITLQLPQLSSTVVSDRQLSAKRPQSQPASESPTVMPRASLTAAAMMRAQTRNEDFESSYMANLKIDSSIHFRRSLYERNSVQRSSRPSTIFNGEQILRADTASTETHSPCKVQDFESNPIPIREKVCMTKASVVDSKSPPEGGDVEQYPLITSINNNESSNLDIPTISPTKSATKTIPKIHQQGINVEQIAQELKQMSHYEVLDLRKRNSLGISCTKDGQSSLSKGEQLALEQCISSELSRRALDSNLAKIRPLRVSIAKPSKSLLRTLCLQPSAEPLEVNNNSKRDDQTSMSVEPSNNSKLLDTKVKDHNQSQASLPIQPLSSTISNGVQNVISPKPQRGCYAVRADAANRVVSSNLSTICSEIEIAPAPPASTAADSDKISIVPPPPSTLRFSQAMCRSQNAKHMEQVEENKTSNEQSVFEVNSSAMSAMEPPSASFVKPGLPSNTSMFYTTQPKLRDTTMVRNQSRTRLKRMQPPMTKELSDYLALQNSIQKRIKSNLSNTVKRSLYNKGDSDTEGKSSQSVLNKQHLPLKVASNETIGVFSETRGLSNAEDRQIDGNMPAVNSYNGIEIVPAPPASKSTDCYDILIMPPPPTSRYSTVVRDSEHSKKNMPNNQEKLQSKQGEHQGMAHENVGQDVTPHEGVPHIEMQHEEVQELQHEKIQDVAIQDGSLQQDTNMEALRMGTPSPIVSSISSQSSPNVEPSTSKAAREALELSLRRQKAENAKQEEQRPRRRKRRKQPPLTQPRSKRNKTQPKKPKKENVLPKAQSPKQSNLGQESDMCQLSTTKMPEVSAVSLTRKDEDETGLHDTSAVRRSKRGHVPLRNSWSHTLDDPFAYMRALYNGDRSGIKPKKKVSFVSTMGSTLDVTNSNKSNTLKRKRMPSQEGNVNIASGVDHDDAEIVWATKRVRKSMIIADTDSEPESEPQPEPVKQAEAQSSVEQTQMEQSNFVHWLQGVCQKKPENHGPIIGEYFSENVSTADHLEFSNLGGIEYASYRTEDMCTLGYMRFQPNQERGTSQTKSNALIFIVLFGKLEIENRLSETSTLEHCILNAGDKVHIKKGCHYNIKNLLDEVSVVIVIRVTNGDDKLT